MRADHRQELRSWLPFALLALAPAVAMGAIAVRATASEEASLQRETKVALEADARAIAQALDDGERDAVHALLAADPTAIDRALAKLARPFAEIVTFDPNGTVKRPSSQIASVEASSNACTEIARTYGSLRDDTRRDARTTLLEKCPDARGPSGRWMWPLVALEHTPLASAPMLGWLGSHLGGMREGERASLAIALKNAPLDDPSLRKSMDDALRDNTLHGDELRALLDDDLARAILRAKPDASGAAHIATATAIADVRVLPDGARVGFVLHRASLAAGIGSLVRADVLAEVMPRGTRRETTTDDWREARFEVTPEIIVRLAPRDLDALARRTSRVKLAVFSAGILATTFAFVLALYLFAKMRAARKLGELRTDFVAAVSHELRTPTASIRMLAELLDQRNVSDEEAPEVHATLAREARRLSDTLQRLLGFGAMSRGKLTVSKVTSSLSKIVGDAVDAFERDHPAMPPVVRRIEPSSEAFVDPALLRIVLDNLLGNALKYAPEGTPYEVALEAADRDIVMKVVDHGPGIPESFRRRVFEPFERIESRLSEATEGSGIGLSLVRGVARAHGGDASIATTEGGGATFVVRFPRGSVS